jgi:UDP-3-O-[3-hydroxymyristoyl] glucosamine N-acyltransferase
VEKRVHKLGELAGIVRGRVVGDARVEITGVAAIRDAGEGEIAMVAGAEYERYLESTRASAILRSDDTACSLPSIVVEKPYLAFARLLDLFAVTTDAEIETGVHPTSVVDPTAELAAGVRIGPHCRIGRGARVGAGTRMLFGVFVGDRVTVGRDCLLYANVTVREQCEIGDRVVLHPGVVIGADGFGYTWDGVRHVKIPQIGRVVVEDDVEIGANSAVDRATTGATRICRGTKIDNLVQVGHNCVIGRDSILAGQTGVAGSTEIGERVIVGGQTGFMGHLRVGDGAVIGAQSGVTKSVPPGMRLSGYPAREHGFARRLWAYTARLPEIFGRVKALEARLAKLEEGTTHGQTTEDDR